MHQTQVREIIRDVDIAHAIAPIARRRQLSVAALTDLLTQASIPRARRVAEMVDLRT